MARLAPSLVRARTTIDARWPNRDRTLDGWIGDAAHQAVKSDHNPNARNIVDAIDVDKDRIHVPTVIASFIVHPSSHYVIFNRRIMDRDDRFLPRAYTGSNPHTGHIHESIRQSVSAEQDPTPWSFIAGLPSWPVLRKGHTGNAVLGLQAVLNGHGGSLVCDGVFGAKTDAAVRAFQRRFSVRNSVINGNGDGLVGPFTRAALFSA